MSIERVREHFDKDHFATDTAGIELTDLAPGKAVARMDLGPQHHNSIGTVHGGAVFTLADYAFAAATNASGRIAVAIDAHISFCKAAAEGVITATAQVLSESYKISTCEVRVTNEADELLATFHGTAYRKSETIPGLESPETV
jgi:acyl-CoA thioesterase